MLTPYFKSSDKNFYLLHGETSELFPLIDHQFDMVFADPPSILSNNVLSIQNRQIVLVKKGKWGKSEGFEYVNDFNRKWLSLVRDKMNDDAIIWISDIMHNIFLVEQILTELGFKILNVITSEKTNSLTNFLCCCFTYSTLLFIWARKCEKVKHYYNYELMKQLNSNKQMKDVWKHPAIALWEKSYGKHTTQKPLTVLIRLILASIKAKAWILAPFAGRSTTRIAQNLANRRFLGIDQEEVFLEISKNSKLEIENLDRTNDFNIKIIGFTNFAQFSSNLKNELPKKEIKVAFGFCRTKALKYIKDYKTFYFHAIRNNKTIIDFPTGIFNAIRLVLYSGSRSKPLKLTGFYAGLKSIEFKHKSNIKGKENSSIEYYYEVILDEVFKESKELKFELNLKKLFVNSDEKSKNLIKKYLPTFITWDRLTESNL